MSREETARLTWIRPDDGGRRSPPPGPSYSTVARFPDHQGADWLKDAWSLVIQYLEAPDSEGTHKVMARFLSENGPVRFLAPGSRFELMEGSKLVARGVVLGEGQREIAFPIFISEPKSLHAYDSIADAQLDLEPVDVEGGVYTGYDSEGRRLVLQASGVRRGWFGSIDQSRATFTISAGEVGPTHAESLRRLLIKFLSAVETDKSPLESLSLQELEKRALPHAKVHVKRSWRR